MGPDWTGRVPSVSLLHHYSLSLSTFTTSSPLCLFSTLWYWSICLNVCLRRSRPVSLLCLCGHINTWVESTDVKTLDDLQREYDVCAGEGPWRVFKVSLHWDWSCSLGNDEHLKQTQVADLMDAVLRGPQSNRAYHIFWGRVPFFYYMICHRHRKTH